MTSDSASPAHPLATGTAGDEIDWEKLRGTLRRFLAGRLSGAERDACEDLVQESLVRVLRAIRTEPPRSLEALALEIARRTWTDHVRRARRWRVLMRPGSATDEDSAELRSLPNDPIGDPLARVEFVVLEFFDAHRASCYELATAYFQSLRWEDVARRTGLNAATVRQRWTRCVQALRAFAQRSPDLLLAWDQMSDAG